MCIESRQQYHVLTCLCSLRSVLEGSNGNGQVLCQPLLPRRCNQFIRRGNPQSRVILSQVRQRPNHFPSPKLLYNHFQLSAQVHLTSDGQRPLRCTKYKLCHQLQRLLFRYAPTSLLSDDLCQASTFHSYLEYKRERQANLRSRSTAPILCPNHSIYALHRTTGYEDKANMPIRAKFRRTSFVHYARYHQTNILFTRSQRKLPCRLLFLFQRERRRINGDLTNSSRRCFYNDPNESRSLPNDLRLQSYPVNEHPANVRRFTRYVQTIAIRRLIITCFLCLTNSNNASFCRFLT